ncbi:DUF4158 domain-containing protein, partial [Bradyrhizobium sp. Arg314]
MRRRPHNKPGFAIQLCVMRHTGRLLGEDEQPHAVVIRHLADQLGVDSRDYAIYARRMQTRFEHSRFLTEHLSLHIANKNDRRAALLSAIDAAAAGDKGHPIVTAVISAFRQRGALLPSQAAIETLGLGRSRHRTPTRRNHTPRRYRRREVGSARRSARRRPGCWSNAIPLAAISARRARCFEPNWTDRTDRLPAHARNRS